MKVYGIIGKPLSHSFSPAYFSAKFKKLGMDDACYKPFLLDSVHAFPSLIEQETELCGLNVTIPYKEAIIPMLDEISDEARAIGAVNTIKVNREQGTGNSKKILLQGYNTDVFGFRQSIKPFLASHHHKALILGTGGASKAVAFVLKQIGIEYLLVSRSEKPGTITYTTLNEDLIAAHRFIINTTPAGMLPDNDSIPPMNDSLFKAIGSTHFVYDLIYNPSETLFLGKAKAQGALVMNGLTMLEQQAEESWKIWNS